MAQSAKHLTSASAYINIFQYGIFTAAYPYLNNICIEGKHHFYILNRICRFVIGVPLFEKKCKE